MITCKHKGVEEVSDSIVLELKARVDELEIVAKLISQRTNAGNADIGPDGRSKERKAIVRLLRERAAIYRKEFNL